MAQHLKSKSFSIFIHDCSMWSNLLVLKSTSERGYPRIIIKGDFNYPEVEWTTSKSAEHNNQKFIDTCRDAYMYQHIQEPKKALTGLGPRVTSPPSSQCSHLLITYQDWAKVTICGYYMNYTHWLCGVGL